MQLHMYILPILQFFLINQFNIIFQICVYIAQVVFILAYNNNRY